jgi:hypothetical protein
MSAAAPSFASVKPVCPRAGMQPMQIQLKTPQGMAIPPRYPGYYGAYPAPRTTGFVCVKTSATAI